MKIRHHHTNIYEVTNADKTIIWFRGTWKECQKYMNKENAKNKK